MQGRLEESLEKSILPPARRAGVCLPLASLPGPWAIGDIGRSARRFVDELQSMQLGVWQILPAGPTGYGDSPYQSLSAFAGNEMLLDLQDLRHLGLLRPGELASAKESPQGAIDYARLIPARRALLAAAAARFDARADAATRAAFEAFVAMHDDGWLHDYALYRVLKRRHEERPWPAWEPALAMRQRGALQKLQRTARSDITVEKILQFLFHRQFRRLHDHAVAAGVRLFGDVPIYIAHDSADAWASRENFRLDRDGKPRRVAGVPPDYFSAAGQRWGNPLHDWQHQAADGFAWWTARLRHALQHLDFVRLDHFRGFESCWSIPAAAPTAKDGRWEPGPGAALFDALHEALGRLPLIAEDLGEITPEVDALRTRFGIPGMKVLQFELLREDFALADIAANSVCYTATHDNDTTVGWFRGSARGRRGQALSRAARKSVLACTGGTPATIHRDVLKLACRSEARWAIAPVQDILGLGSAARLNTPGTTGGNWRWRLSWEQLTPALRDSVCDIVAASARQAGPGDAAV